MDIPREDILNPKPKNDTENSKEPIYFVSTYNPTLKDPKIEIRRAIDTYNTNEKTEDKITVASSYRNSSSLKQILMFRKANKYLGVRKCNEECTLCKNNLHTGPSLTLKTVQLSVQTKFLTVNHGTYYI